MNTLEYIYIYIYIYIKDLALNNKKIVDMPKKQNQTKPNPNF